MEIKNDRFKYVELGRNKTLLMISSTAACVPVSAPKKQPSTWA